MNPLHAAAHLHHHATTGGSGKFLLGLHCHWIKHQILRGEFGPWLRAHAPAHCRLKDDRVPQPRTQLAEAMKFCTDTLKRENLALGDLLQTLLLIPFPADRDYAHAGEWLLLADEPLPPEAAALRDRLRRAIRLQEEFALRRAAQPLPPLTAGSTGRKLTPTERHAAHARGIREETAFVIGRLELWLRRPALDKTEDETIDLRVLDALAKRVREDIAQTLHVRKPGRPK